MDQKKPGVKVSKESLHKMVRGYVIMYEAANALFLLSSQPLVFPENYDKIYYFSNHFFKLACDLKAKIEKEAQNQGVSLTELKMDKMNDKLERFSKSKQTHDLLLLPAISRAIANEAPNDQQSITIDQIIIELKQIDKNQTKRIPNHQMELKWAIIAAYYSLFYEDLILNESLAETSKLFKVLHEKNGQQLEEYFKPIKQKHSSSTNKDASQDN